MLWSKCLRVTHLLQQKSLLLLFCQLIRREGALDSGPDHYAVILFSGRHAGYTWHLRTVCRFTSLLFNLLKQIRLSKVGVELTNQAICPAYCLLGAWTMRETKQASSIKCLCVKLDYAWICQD